MRAPFILRVPLLDVFTELLSVITSGFERSATLNNGDEAHPVVVIEGVRPAPVEENRRVNCRPNEVGLGGEEGSILRDVGESSTE